MKSIEGKRVFVTGATGYIGSWLVDHLLRDGAEVCALSRRPQRNPRVKWIQGDIRSFKLDGEFDIIVHGAGTSASHKTEEIAAEMIEGTEMLIAKSRGVGRVVYLSSGAVYGELSRAAVETDEPGPGLTPYGRAKRQCEEMLSKNFDHVLSARIFAVCGPRLPLESPFALSHFFKAALAGKPITVRSSGASVRSFIDVEDLARGLVAMMTCESRGCYNLTGGEVVTIMQVAEMVNAIAKGKGVKILNEPENVTRYYGANDRAAADLDFTPRIDLHTSLTRTWDWLRVGKSLWSGPRK